MFHVKQIEYKVSDNWELLQFLLKQMPTLLQKNMNPLKSVE